MDVVPRRSAELRLHRVVRQIPDAAVHQIRGARQIQGVLRGLPVRRGHQCPSGCVSGASDEVHRHTGQGRRRGHLGHQGRWRYAADSCQGRSKAGDRRLACRAEFLRPGQGCPCQVQLEAEWVPCKRAVGRSAALPSCEQVELAAWVRRVVLSGLIQLRWLE